MKIKRQATLCTLQCPSDRLLHAWAQKVRKCGIKFDHRFESRATSNQMPKLLYLDVPCRSKSGCGPTNDQAVDSPHNVLTSNAFPDNVLTNVSPNIVQQIVKHVHSSHAGFHAKAVTSQWQLVGRPRSEAVCGMSRQSC